MEPSFPVLFLISFVNRADVLTALVTAAMMMIRPVHCCSTKTWQTQKEKNERKTETSPECSSSDSENFSYSGDSIEESNSTKSHRFQIISKSKSHKWEFPGELAGYVNQQFECLIPEKDVKENLLILQPVPIKKLDDFVKFIIGQSVQVLNQFATMKSSNRKL